MAILLNVPVAAYLETHLSTTDYMFKEYSKITDIII